ncbi:MAG: PSD1 and planctomycete cytochrome C domain-containing protein [Pirellulaceae bacterium]|jgi:hypothetical protein|nr:PSD1 and planctomycete cytochrome C domain-containing protein [Pirellulaceae bacterium]
MKRLTLLISSWLATAACPALLWSRDDGLDAAGVEFFESQVRPLLARRCFACHSDKSDPIEGGLRLDSRPGWQAGGDSGAAIVPGKPAESRLLKAVLYQDPMLAMPPDNALPRREIEVLRKWISLGAPDPRSDAKSTERQAIDWRAAREFWSFQPIRSQRPPAVKDNAWVRAPIDRFVLAQLEARDLRPVGRAAKRTLVRRVFLDVLGLPPTPAELQSFLNDTSPDAWPRLVDRLLASPHYGERWGRHWLDVARYADDQLKAEFFYRELPHAWRYRDWVVRALNEDLPYDQFILQQLAGDLVVESHGRQAVAATGFLALGMIYQDDGGTPESVAVAKAETLDDRIDTVTRGLLGLTVSCARCHDHKFDPIPTMDYYSLAGVFQSAKYVESAPLVPAEVVGAYHRARAEIEQTKTALAAAEKAGDKEEATRLRSALADQSRSAPDIYPRAHAMLEGDVKDMRVALRGNLLKPGDPAPRRFLRVLAGDAPPLFRQGSGRRQLAHAIASPDNPLTARVMANRVWQHYFGRGIVASASDFGSRGQRPTHPQLLDWLASQLIDGGWSLKNLHRQILLSATYRLSTQHDAANAKIDGGNHWLWRMNRRRLTIEAYRDSLLSAAGTLDTRIGGRAEANLLASSRRTIYGVVRRDNQSESDDLLRMFDFPNPRLSASGRASTVTAQQQLFTLNSPFIIARARELAARTLAESSRGVDQKLLDRVFSIVFSRPPTSKEAEIAMAFVNDAIDEPAKPAAVTLSPWEQYCQILLISNEAIYRP